MERVNYLNEIKKAFTVHPVVALLGPRQCGKSTLARQYAKQFNLPQVNYFDLENPIDVARLEASPILTLTELTGLIIIDEIQLSPDIFKSLRVVVDKDRKQRQFLILGSASQALIHQSSETLAGRIQMVELTPFDFQETHDLKRLWVRGGFPESYLADAENHSETWRKSYIRTYLERDIPNLGINIAARTLRRFWMMLTHYHGNIFNASELGKSIGVSNTSCRRYLELLAGTFMVRELQPWYENINKRQVKSPKVYFRDSGLYHALLDIPDYSALQRHPKLGASWEGMALEEVIRFHKASQEECYFWGVHSQVELDLLIIKAGRRLGFEFKFSDQPKLSRSMNQAMEILQLDSLTIISPGSHDFPLAEKIRAVGLMAYVSCSG